MPHTPRHPRPTTRQPVTVAVCTHSRPQLLPDCVAAIAAAMGSDDELIVVESGDSGARLALDALDVPSRLIRTANRAKSAKLNLAVGAAARDVLLLTDDDCRVESSWPDAMAEPMSAHDTCGVCFGPVEGLDRVPGRAGAQLPAGLAPIENWAYAHGASMAVRRAAVLEVGGFDERLGPGTATHGEEADMVVRMAERGWTCWLAAAPPVVHLAWRDTAESLANLLVYERGAGAWLGAGLRRDPGHAAKLLALRLLYQAELWQDRRARGRWFGPRTTAAFLGGVARGLTYRPRRWLSPDRNSNTSRRADRGG